MDRIVMLSPILCRTRGARRALALGGTLGCVLGCVLGLPRPAAAAAGAAAQGAPSPASAPAPAGVEPRFLIETISVEGVRRQATRTIVISQSYLKTGHSYTERELQEAVFRVKRLPFVVEAEVALRKGSERGRYQLVLTVEETRPLFLDNAVTAVHQAPFGKLTWGDSATLAVRQFVGAAGFAFASFSNGTAQSRSWQLGYTQYGVFGGNSYASLVAAAVPQSSFGRTLSVDGSVAVPLSGNVMVIASPGWTLEEGPGSTRSDSWSTNLALVYRTTDDPIIPTSGADVEAAVFGDYAQTTIEFAGGAGTFRFHGYEATLSLLATDYWPITRRQSIGLSASAAAGRDTEVEFLDNLFLPFALTGKQGSVTLIYTASLWDAAATRRFGDLRLEASAGYSIASSAIGGSGSLEFAPIGTVRQVSLGAGVVFRDQWAILRFNFAYLGPLVQ
ncbi:MAG TPA: BamA/TamA family outer membrane protein [Thermoanaerobaculia bacterium]|jgi:hypothetical protein|nr:BamA/TamA family outer membrane protein [Thermoanaerobaculia bacterium]